MPNNVITEKISDIAPGQILSFYNFYKIQEEKSYSFYKNDKNFFLFVFYDETNEIKFIETIQFRVLDKVSLFYFLADRLEMDSLLKNIKEIISIEDFDKFHFTEAIQPRVLINAYYRLEESEFLKGTPLEKLAFRRDGSDVLVFNDGKNTPVDLVSFVENEEEVFSEFGNNFGLHFLKNINSNALMVTFHPEILFKTENRDKYNTLITKYNVPLIDVISILRREEIKEINIPVSGIYSFIYKLQLLLKFHNFFNSQVRYELNISPNNCFAELYFTLHGNASDKLNVMQHVASMQNDLKKLFEEQSDTIKNKIYDFYSFSVDMFSSGNNHCGKIVFRNNISLLDICIRKFENVVNEYSFNEFKFV